MTRPLWLVANRIILTLFAIALVFTSIVALHEIFFAIPLCPGNAANCGMREAHFAGSRLVGATLLGLWAFVLLWIMATRSRERRGTPGLLAAFWAGPVVIICFFYFQ